MWNAQINALNLIGTSKIVNEIWVSQYYDWSFLWSFINVKTACKFIGSFINFLRMVINSMRALYKQATWKVLCKFDTQAFLELYFSDLSDEFHMFPLLYIHKFYQSFLSDKKLKSLDIGTGPIIINFAPFASEIVLSWVHWK